MIKKYEKIINLIPKDGFLKLTDSVPHSLQKSDRAALIRKGNFFFNKGEYKKAERIFITTGYGDGLIRMGDYYKSHNDPLNAIKMYWLAPDSKRVEEWVQKASYAIKEWIKEDVKIKR